MKYFFFILLGTLTSFKAVAIPKAPKAVDILKSIDANRGIESLIIKSTMTVNNERNSRSFESRSWIKGKNSLTEYLAPPREKGIKMLKLGNTLHTYNPKVKRIIKISGHQLRQPLMGSDISYNEVVETRKLHEIYEAEIIGDVSFQGSPCHLMKLTAKTGVSDINYAHQKLWVDKVKLLPLREEFYSRDGKTLIKTVTVDKVEFIKGHWYAMEATYKDHHRTGFGTKFRVQEIQINPPIPAGKFNKSALTR